MSDEDKRKFLISCMSKSRDSINDMIVEYLTAFAAGGMFLMFGNMTGLFIFAVGSVNTTHVYAPWLGARCCLKFWVIT